MHMYTNDAHTCQHFFSRFDEKLKINAHRFSLCKPTNH